SRRHRRLHGSGLRNRGRADALETIARLLGKAQRQVRGGGVIRPFAASFRPSRAIGERHTCAKPRGNECSRSTPASVISKSSPVCTPALPSRVTTLGCTTTVMPASNGSAGTGPAGRLLLPRIGGKKPPPKPWRKRSYVVEDGAR